MLTRSMMLNNSSRLPPLSGRGVTAVLGPTNTGKTHLAIERMIGHSSGIIGLPLRLLAREVYQRIVSRLGVHEVALITGEEKIIPPNARFRVCTVEAMPHEIDVAFVAIDEVQLATDLERGHIFTDRILNLRGREETMLLGAATVRPVLEGLLPGINVITRPRMSQLSWAGQKKITRLPRRSAIVAFSADEVYAIAELIRRQRGGAAVVLGSLSPRTRNAQVELYQSGDVDFLVATDAIGMGLNLDVDHVAFAQDKKFDGHQYRRLTPAEYSQIAGRAGRHANNGTFGVTGQVDPLEDTLVEALESHSFAPEKVLQWRNRALDTSSLQNLKLSLDLPSHEKLLVKSPPAIDQRTLEILASRNAITDRLKGEDDVRLLWEVSQIPDYRRIAPANHADMAANIFFDISDTGTIDETWFAEQVSQTDDTRGEIDTLSNRIAHIRTWTFISNRAGWLPDPVHWQEKTRDIEDRLSDALHERLTKRFVDRRTSVLMKRLRENAMLEVEISKTGEVKVEGHHVGQLRGFRFTADSSGESQDAKAARNAAQKALASEIESRAEKLTASANADFALDSNGIIRWLGEPVAKLAAGDELLKPRLILLADEQLTGPARDKVAARLERWISFHIETLLKPLVEISAAADISGLVRGVAFRLVENLGVIDRREIADDIRALDQDARGMLRRHGVRFGAYHIFIPALLKPAPATLATILWAIKHDKMEAKGLNEIPGISAAGRTSVAVDPEFLPELYRLSGFRILGNKAVRVDILERLADLIRPAIMWREGSETKRPDGGYEGNGFLATPAMLSILGATHEDMVEILSTLGYRADIKPQLVVDKRLAEIDPETIPDAMENTSKDAVPTTLSNPINSQDTAKPADSDQPAAAGANLPAEPEQETPEEEKTVAIWRPVRQFRSNSNNRAGRKPNTNQARTGAGDDKSRHKRSKSGHRDNKNKRHSKPQQRPLDPDSPFAKLAALKASLESNK